MNRSRRLAVSSAAVLVLSVAFSSAAFAGSFLPGLQAQNPTAVNGNTTSAVPNMAFVLGHTGSMMENIATGRADFVPGAMSDAIPTTGCFGPTCACNGGASGDSFAAAPSFHIPSLLRLACRDTSLSKPLDGSGPLALDVKNVNEFARPTGTTAGDQYQAFMARLFPDIDFTSDTSCLSASCTEGANSAGEIVSQYAGTTYDEGFDRRRPDGLGSVCPATGDNCDVLNASTMTGDGVSDRSVYPMDVEETPSSSRPYEFKATVPYHITSLAPASASPDPALNGNFRDWPYIEPDTSWSFNHPIRKQHPGAGVATPFTNTKIRASFCALKEFLGDKFDDDDQSGDDRTCDFDDLGNSAADDANGNKIDDFFEKNVQGKANFAIFSPNLRAPGFYPPFDEDNDFTENREKISIRVNQVYGAGSTNPGAVDFGCNAATDEACNRSMALLMPDLDRVGASSDLVYSECMGLSRLANASSGFSSVTNPIQPDDAAINLPMEIYEGWPGGVMSLSGILRDACGNNGNCPGSASPGTKLPSGVTSNGIFAADTNSCGSSNALVIITDSPDSCADSTCATSTGERLPGYAATPAQPFPTTSGAKSNCPDSIAAAMRASNRETKTYIVGLDADWDVTTKRSVSAVAAAGGTNGYYPARSFSDVQNALRAIYNDVKFSGDAVIPAGVFALGIARADSTNLKDVVIDARYKPQNWQGFLFAREITQSGQPLAFWEAGSLLAARDLSLGSAARKGFTTLDLNCDGKIGGSDERVAFTTSNTDLVTAGGPYAVEPSCTGAPRTSLKNAHNTGAPFFLDGQVDATQGWSDRDGNAIAMIGYTLGMTQAQIAALSGVALPATTYRSRDFDGNGTPGDSVWRLYDSVNSSPVIVGPSLSIQASDADADGDGLTDFEEYQARVLDRPRVVYIGTNGGSLHGFNVDGDTSIHVGGAVVNGAGATPGGEVFVMWPHEILNRLKRYANASYGTTDGLGNRIHEDGIDLTARIFDAKIYPNSEGAPLFGWRTVLVIGDRNGGHGYMALDVTDPSESMGIEDKDASGTFVSYTYPTLLWEFDQFKDDGHSDLGDPLEPEANCDDDTDRTLRAGCEDNGQDDNTDDRLGRSWSIPFVTRSRTGDGKPVMYVLSGPGTIENTGGSSTTSGGGYLLAIDISTGSLIDLDSTTSNGLPLKVTDPAISTGPNAGPVCVGGTGVACTGGQFIAPFRTSIAGVDVTTSDDATYSGQRADVLYWGDLGGRLWRGRFSGATSNDIETRVLFFPGADTNTVDTAHPIVSRPSMTPSKNQTLLGAAPPLLVIWGDGSLAFGPADVAEGLYPVDETGSDEKFRIFAVVDNPTTGAPQYLDGSDETNCSSGTNATSSSADGPTSNSGGDLDNRTLPSTTYPSITDPQDPPSGTHPPTTTGGYYQCLANNAGTGITGATGSERILGSPAILGGAVVVETMRPVSPVSNICYNVGTGSILAFDYATAGLINFTLKGGVTSNGGGKYFTAPENPVAVANTPGYKTLGAPPDGFPPDFLRYHVVTGAQVPAPQIPSETIYWREPF